MKIITIEQEKNVKEKLPQVLNRIFEICKSDPNFPMKEKLESLEESILRVKQKIKKQDELLEKSKEISKDFSKKISFYEEENEELRGKILESLGSEI
jgi:hypothetical protein